MAVEDTSMIIFNKTPTVTKVITVALEEGIEADIMEDMIKVPTVEDMIKATIEDLARIANHNHITIQYKNLI